MSLHSSEKRVVPGELLGVAEEYEAGPGTYVDEEGFIRAAVPGVARYDSRSRSVRVDPVKRPRLPGVGSEVVGVVTSVRHDVVVLDLIGEVRLQPVPRFLYEFPSRLSGAITIANIAEEYVKDINDYYRVGDIVLARTLNGSTPYHLTTVQPQYGVIYAYCSRCGNLLEPVNNRTMKCPACGHVEKRKVSALAGSKLLSINVRWGLVIPLS